MPEGRTARDESGTAPDAGSARRGKRTLCKERETHEQEHRSIAPRVSGAGGHGGRRRRRRTRRLRAGRQGGRQRHGTGGHGLGRFQRVRVAHAASGDHRLRAGDRLRRRGRAGTASPASPPAASCAEEGKKVYLVEKQPEDTFNAVGNEFASLNSTILKERGVPQIDPVEFFQNWMTITGNYPNQELVMKFAQNSAETTDWYLSELTDDDFATMTTAFFPKTEHQLDNIGPIKFWPSVCSFYGECNQTKIHGYNREVAKQNGAEFLVLHRGALCRHGRRRRCGPGGNERRGQPQVQLQGRRHRVRRVRRQPGDDGRPHARHGGSTGGRRSAHRPCRPTTGAACRWPTGPARTWRRAPSPA